MLNSLDMYLQNLSQTRKFLKCIGLDVYQKNFKINWILTIVVLDIIVYIIANGYSAYIFRKDFDKFMFCLMTWSLGFMVCSSCIYKNSYKKSFHPQGLGYVASFYFNRSGLLEMNLEIIEFHKNKNNNPEILIKYGKVTEVCLKWISRLFLACFLVSISFGPIMCVYTNSLVLTFGFQLPFISVNSLHGFFINFMFQNSCIYFAYKGFNGFMRIYFYLFINGCTEIDTIIDSLLKFSEFIDANFEFNQNFDIEAKDYLQTIIKLHKKNTL